LKNIQSGFREMANGRGGRRPGAGRKAGGHNKRTLEFHAEVAKSGCTPLEHMLAVLHDPKANADRRDRMAVAAAPFIHPKLAVVDSTVKLAAEVTVTLSEDERRERARRMIAEAFAERPPLTVEGQYKVIAGRDVASDVAAAGKDNCDVVAANCGEQAKGEAPHEREG